ncbi:hypothetical protein V7183_24125 [Bacillus sp. JJ1127]|uniref:hypothetical protein n=1 Tax=Bacillus sp. JJ1127 TaxID=3122952 RepID=UPI002FFE1EF6
MFSFITSPLGVACSTVLIVSSKARKAIRKAAVKTTSAVLRIAGKIDSTDSEVIQETETIFYEPNENVDCMEDGVNDSDLNHPQESKVKTAIRRAAVRTTIVFLGIAEKIEETVSSLQEKWASFNKNNALNHA